MMKPWKRKGKKEMRKASDEDDKRLHGDVAGGRVRDVYVCILIVIHV